MLSEKCVKLIFSSESLQIYVHKVYVYAELLGFGS
jgi:hypothetical protein